MEMGTRGTERRALGGPSIVQYTKEGNQTDRDGSPARFLRSLLGRRCASRRRNAIWQSRSPQAMGYSLTKRITASPLDDSHGISGPIVWRIASHDGVAILG